MTKKKQFKCRAIKLSETKKKLFTEGVYKPKFSAFFNTSQHSEMRLVVVLIAELLCAFSVDSQSCADDCKIVCGSDLPPVLTGPPGTVRRGKHGPKGQKGEVGLPGVTGLPGKDGLDRSDQVSEISSTMQIMKEIVYKGFSREIAKSNNNLR